MIALKSQPLRCADVTSLPENGSTNTRTNLRPISVLNPEIPFHSFHFKFFIHGGPINQEWLLFRGPWKKPNYNATKIKKNIYNVKLE